LTTLATAKVELGVTGTTDDNKILNHIRQASDQIAAYCNRVFGLETVEEHWYDANFKNALPLRRRPVRDVISVELAGSGIDSSEWRLDEKRGILQRATSSLGWNGYPFWQGEILVQYEAGYALLGDLPYDIERACLMLVKQYYFNVAVDPFLRSEDIPGVASFAYGFGPSARTESNLPPEVQALLSSYKEICFA
jgi:hypothetical protein